MKIENRKIEVHEGELDYTVLPAFPNSEHRAERVICRRSPVGRRRKIVSQRLYDLGHDVATYPLK